MDKWKSLENPDYLEDGRRYLRLQSFKDDRSPVVELVTFRGYTACPAVVIVQVGESSRVRCAREELFLLAGATSKN